MLLGQKLGAPIRDCSAAPCATSCACTPTSTATLPTARPKGFARAAQQAVAEGFNRRQTGAVRRAARA